MTKKILLILADKDFREGELFVPKVFFANSNKLIVHTASKSGKSIGHFGYKLTNDITTDQFNANDYDILFFVGGFGCLEYAKDRYIQKQTQKMLDDKKIVAAICLAPRILLQWGMLENKNMTGWNDDDKLPNLANKANANYIKEWCVSDGNIITGSGIEATETLATKILSKI